MVSSPPNSTKLAAKLRNVVIGGWIGTLTLPIAGSKTRFKGRRQYQFGAIPPNGGIQFAFCNWYLQLSSTVPEVAITNAITINQAAAVIGSTYVALTQNGASTITIPAGSAITLSDPIFPADFGLTEWPAGGLIEYRHQYDLTSGQVAPYDNSSQRPGTQAYRYIPADDPGGDIYATGALSLPTGSPDLVGIFFPSAILGYFASPSPSLAILGDSIEYGTGNNPAQSNGYGWTRSYAASGCQYGGVPCWDFGVSGLTAADFNSSSTGYLSQMLKYCNSAYMKFGSNDLNYSQTGGGQTTAAIVMASLSARSTWLRSNGIQRIIVGTIPPRMQPDNYRCTDLTHQTYFVTQAPGGLGFESGGQRDILNAALKANPRQVGADQCFDFGGYCSSTSDPSRWPVSSFTATLTSASAASASSLAMSANPTANELLVLEPGNSNYDGGQMVSYSVSGSSSPYTANLTYTDSYSNSTLGNVPANSHAIGAAVAISYTVDGTHPAVNLVIPTRRYFAAQVLAALPYL